VKSPDPEEPTLLDATLCDADAATRAANKRVAVRFLELIGDGGRAARPAGGEEGLHALFAHIGGGRQR
jgi:hypothetical protein